MDASPSLGARILRAAPTRLVLYLLGVAAAGALVTLVLQPVRAHTHLPSSVRYAIFSALIVPATVAVYVALVRWLERRPVTELAGPGAARELGVGVLAGAGLFATTIGIIALLGGYTVTGTHPASVLLPSLVMAVQSGVTEEVVARGILFRVLEEWLGTWAALAISSALFGLGHIGNPHATVWSAVAIAVEAGTLLAAAYLVTRRLWLAIGLHAAWNFTQGGIFGVAVSGNETEGLLRGEMHGPAWVSGGEFGAEASVVATAVCGAAAVVLIMRVLRGGGRTEGGRVRGVMGPSWTRS